MIKTHKHHLIRV